jgi:hypothetical protein
VDRLDGRSVRYSVEQSLQKLHEAQSALRSIVLFARDPSLDHSLIEAHALIRRAISILKEMLPNRER